MLWAAGGMICICAVLGHQLQLVQNLSKSLRPKQHLLPNPNCRCFVEMVHTIEPPKPGPTTITTCPHGCYGHAIVHAALAIVHAIVAHLFGQCRLQRRAKHLR